MTRTKVFILLSGGLDSSVTLARAREEFPEAQLEAVSINYGQRHECEIKSAETIAKHYGASHIVLDLSGLMSGMLVGAEQAIPEVSYAELAPGISPTYVTFRNGLMVSVLAARAQGWVMAQEAAVSNPHTDKFEAVLYCGVHADDGVNWAYPDCTPEFMGPMAAAIFVGTYHKVRLRTPYLYASKTEIVLDGNDMGVPMQLTWSCYKGEELQCGVCPTCRSRIEAFKEAGVLDHTEYQDHG
jgi:7-cyano-7-deazaguanine synthase